MKWPSVAAVLTNDDKRHDNGDSMLEPCLAYRKENTDVDAEKPKETPGFVESCGDLPGEFLADGTPTTN